MQVMRLLSSPKLEIDKKRVCTLVGKKHPLLATRFEEVYTLVRLIYLTIMRCLIK